MTRDDFVAYRYRGHVVRVIDGDTLRIRLQLGLYVELTVDLRLAGINAPEVVGATRAAGEAARDWLAALLGQRLVYVQTFRDTRSFSRFVADCYISDEGGELQSVAELMVASGHATPWPPVEVL